ncbi:MAG: hypothetical protein HY254_22210 [Burkholderiales bacterium]|nr:hypothetical protein [Burkholderiales bacterium]
MNIAHLFLQWELRQVQIKNTIGSGIASAIINLYGLQLHMPFLQYRPLLKILQKNYYLWRFTHTESDSCFYRLVLDREVAEIIFRDKLKLATGVCWMHYDHASSM